MKIAGDVDVANVLAGLQGLANEKITSLTRSMGVAGGQVLRDEAKAHAPVEAGKLRDSLYLAFKDGKSAPTRATYSVTWNSRKAPHGHLLEFGHWQPYTVVRRPDGSYFTDKSKPLAQPKWIAAHPFLRPAYMAAAGRAIQAMQARGRERLAELLAETNGP